jgi:hypothetical protein
MPGSARTCVVFPPTAGAGAVGGGALPGTVPGADRIGRFVRGLLANAAGDLVGVAVAVDWGA